MNRFFFSPKFLAAAALATAALGAATAAQAARPDVYFSIGLNSGPHWAQPAPVYVQPRPVFVAPRPVFEPPRFGRYDARIGWERERAWRHGGEWRRHDRHEEFRGRGHDRNDRNDDHGRRGGHRD